MCAQQPAQEVKNITHYSIAIPSGYDIKDVSPPMMDFYVFQVAKASDPKISCRLYIGNAPDFPTYSWHGKSHDSTDGNRISKVHPFDEKTGKMEGMFRFSGLTSENGSQTPFSCIHYFAEGIQPVDAAAFSAMVKTIKVVKPRL